jgi:hypothetical protein
MGDQYRSIHRHFEVVVLLNIDEAFDEVYLGYLNWFYYTRLDPSNTKKKNSNYGKFIPHTWLTKLSSSTNMF